jgi:Protein of unknown function (DUF2946)
MQEWVLKSLERWPNVPALFGWLGLDRRGRWLIKGEPITHPRIVETINRNYGVDEHGRWYFQNGPQRGYVALEYAPFVLRTDGDRFITHNGLAVAQPSEVIVDEHGAVSLATEHGLGEIAGADLDRILEAMTLDDQPVDEVRLASLLAHAPQVATRMRVAIAGRRLAVVRWNESDLPKQYGFVRDPQPRPGERTSQGAPD